LEIIDSIKLLKLLKMWIFTSKNMFLDGWMDGWMDGCKSSQQSKTAFSEAIKDF
jgi:hypothetical protein